MASPFGAQMDSLADMCSFGLAAPVVVYASLAGTVSTPAAAVACALVAGCAAIRLARFNVSPKDGRFFCGVPTTMAAAVLALAVLIGLPVSGELQVAGVALLAFAMVSSFPYAKLARLVKLPPWLWVLPVVGALVDVRLTFALVVVGYLVSGPLLWLQPAQAPDVHERAAPSGAALFVRPPVGSGQRQRAMIEAPPRTRSPGATVASAASAGR